jgi:hypothetical protein
MSWPSLTHNLPAHLSKETPPSFLSHANTMAGTKEEWDEITVAMDIALRSTHRDTRADWDRRWETRVRAAATLLASVDLPTNGIGIDRGLVEELSKAAMTRSAVVSIDTYITRALGVICAHYDVYMENSERGSELMLRALAKEIMEIKSPSHPYVLAAQAGIGRIATAETNLRAHLAELENIAKLRAQLREFEREAAEVKEAHVAKLKARLREGASETTDVKESAPATEGGDES